MRTIYLIGLMGVGKSSVGKQLASRLNRSFWDTDQVIINETGQSIAQLFQEYGEPAFRNLETAILQQLPTENAVIATGGGIVEKTENRNWLKQHGIIIFLQAEINEIQNRINSDPARPLFPHLKQLAQTRKPLYQEITTYSIETTGQTEESVVQICLDFLTS